MAKKVLLLIAFIAISVSFYILLDFLYAKIFSDDGFHFEWGADVIYPGVLATAMGLFIIFGARKDDSSKKSSKAKDNE